MTGRKDIIFNLVSISLCYIGLPNNAQTLTILEGRVYLSPNIMLQNVLFVPGLACNIYFLSLKFVLLAGIFCGFL